MKTPITTIALALTTLLLAGCTARPTACTSSGSTSFAGQELKVLDQGAWNNAFEFAKPRFEAATGAKLAQIRGQDAGSALKQVLESKGNPVADVFYGLDNTLFLQAVHAGVLEPYASGGLASIDTTVVHLEDFRDHGTLYATPVDHGYVSVNYDARLLSGPLQGALPTTLRDLAKAEWASRLAVEDPRRSSPGLAFLAVTVATFGEDGAYDYLDFWKDLFDRGVLVAPDWSTAYEVHFTGGYGQGQPGFEGDRPLVVSYTTSPAIEAFYGSGVAPSRSLEPAKGVFHQVESAAILRCTKQLPLAKAFIDFLLGREFQDAASETMATYPVIKDATVIAPFHSNATEPSRLTPAPLTSAQIESGVPRWLDAWTVLYQRSHA